LAVSIWGGAWESLAAKPASPEATAVRRLIGDLIDDYAVVFCDI
jgi:hypothetical protein